MGLVTSFVQIGLSWSSEPDLCDVNLSIRVAWSLPYYVTYASWSQIYIANGICQRSPGLWITECQANTQSRLSEGCSCVPFSNSSALAGSHDVKSRPLKKGGGAKSNGRRRQCATDSVQWGDVRQQRSFSIKEFGRSCEWIMEVGWRELVNQRKKSAKIFIAPSQIFHRIITK